MASIAALFFIVAILYSSVGFGGGSGYLAILSTTNLEPQKMRFIALCCNILVVSFNTFFYARTQKFNTKKFIPLVLLSIPCAFLGGLIALAPGTFFLLLALSLLIAGVLMLIQISISSVEIHPKERRWSSSKLINATIGGGIGFLSGLVGIGGGIFLAPFLHLTRWDKSKHIAAAASLFILVNSVAGLLGQVSKSGVPIEFSEVMYPLSAVLVGSLIGVNLSLKWFHENWIKGITALLVIVAAVRILVNQPA